MLVFSMHFTFLALWKSLHCSKMKIWKSIKHEAISIAKTWWGIKTKTSGAAGRGRRITQVGKKERKKGVKKKAHKNKSHPVFGKKQIDGGVSNDVHAELEGLDLPWFSRLGNLGHFHGLVVSRQEELPQTVPENGERSCKREIASVQLHSKALKHEFDQNSTYITSVSVLICCLSIYNI